MSHKITIKPRPLQTNHPIEIKMQAMKYISSFFKNNFPFNPLTREQIEKWMPSLVNMDVTEKGFREAVERYFVEMSIPVPYAGKELEIGLDSKDQPINKEEYIMYLFAKGYRKVASNESEFKSDAVYDFFIDDPKDAAAEREKAYNSTLESSIILAELDKNKTKASYVLAVLNPSIQVHTMSHKEIMMDLSDFVRLNPSGFLKAAKTKGLEELAFINTLNATKIISKVGDAFMYQDIVLGYNLNEVVVYINNPVNSKAVNQMKAKLKQIELSSPVNSEDEYTEDAHQAATAAQTDSK